MLCLFVVLILLTSFSATESLTHLVFSSLVKSRPSSSFSTNINSMSAFSETTVSSTSNISPLASHAEHLPKHELGYDRIDFENLDHPIYKDLFRTQNHALHDTLMGHNMIEVYEIYRYRDPFFSFPHSAMPLLA